MIWGYTHTHTYPYFRNPTPGIMYSQSIKSHRFCCFQSILGSISSIIHKKILLSRSLFLLNGCEVRWLQITSSPGVGWSQKARSEHVGTVSSGSAASDMTRRLCWKQILPNPQRGRAARKGSTTVVKSTASPMAYLSAKQSLYCPAKCLGYQVPRY
jgi:hypothetical protein